MKKTFIFAIIILGLILLLISGIIINRRFEENEAKKPNIEFEEILKKEMYGTDVVTIINKSINNNKLYKIKQDDKGNYLNDNKYSIKIEITFLGNEEKYSMEQICKVGIEKFMGAFNISKFKCTNIEYHNQTGRISKIEIQEI